MRSESRARVDPVLAVVRGAGGLTMERWLIWCTVTAVMFPLSVAIGPVRIALFSIPFCGVLVLWLGRAWNTSRLGHVRPWDVLVVTLASCVIVATVANSPDSVNVGYLSLWLQGLVLAIYAAHAFPVVIGPRGIGRFALIAGSAQAGLGLTQIVSGSTVGSIRAYFGALSERTAFVNVGVARPIGTFSHPNTYAIWQMLLIGVALGVLWAEARERQGLVRTATVLSTTAIVASIGLSLSRAAIALTVLATVAWAVWAIVHVSDRFVLGRLGLRLATSIGILGVIGVVSYGAVTRRLGFEPLIYVHAFVLRGEQTGTATDFRARMNSIAIREGMKRPVWGAGFRRGGELWAGRGDFAVRWVYRPHNIYLTQFVESGSIGLALLVAVFAWAVWAGLKTRKRDLRAYGVVTAVVLGLLGGLVYIEVVDHDIWPLLMLLVGCCAAAVSREVVAPDKELASA